MSETNEARDHSGKIIGIRLPVDVAKIVEDAAARGLETVTGYCRRRIVEAARQDVGSR